MIGRRDTLKPGWRERALLFALVRIWRLRDAVLGTPEEWR